MNHWKHAKKYGVLIVLICAALCFWLSQAQGAEMGSFSGKVFEDLNNDGIMDENDPGVAGVTLRLAGKKTGQTFELVTDETGLFTFADLPKDRYVFTAKLPDGLLYARYSRTGGDLRSVFSGETLEREFSVGQGEAVKDKNVGVIQKGALTGKAFLDLNYNGYYDEGEPGYAHVTMEAIKISNGESMGKTETDDDGNFRLEGLRGGDYRLRIILPDDGSIFTIVPENGGENANGAAQRYSRRESAIEPLTLQSGGEASALVGVAMGAKIRGTVFQDADYNGQLDQKEKRISGVQVQAVDENGQTVNHYRFVLSPDSGHFFIDWNYHHYLPFDPLSVIDPVYEEQVTGHAVVRQTFKASGVGTIAGSYVLDGKITRGSKARITRDGEQIFEGPLASLKRFKDDVKEVAAGYECGLVFEGFNDLQEDDMIEVYIMVEVPR